MGLIIMNHIIIVIDVLVTVTTVLFSLPDTFPIFSFILFFGVQLILYFSFVGPSFLFSLFQCIPLSLIIPHVYNILSVQLTHCLHLCTFVLKLQLLFPFDFSFTRFVAWAKVKKKCYRFTQSLDSSSLLST